jgi:hypothetical protein
MSINVRMLTLIRPDSLLTGKNTGASSSQNTFLRLLGSNQAHFGGVASNKARNDSAIIRDVTGKGFPVPMLLTLTCDERLAGFLVECRTELKELPTVSPEAAKKSIEHPFGVFGFAMKYCGSGDKVFHCRHDQGWPLKQPALISKKCDRQSVRQFSDSSVKREFIKTPCNNGVHPHRSP